VSVVSDSAKSRPSSSESESLIEFDVRNLSLGRPVLMSKNPLDEGSVLSELVLLDEFRSRNSDLLPSSESLEASDGRSPSLQRPFS